ncbi:TPA: DUF262 domain-containing protein, partial [Pluralibacter gergoviae]
MSSDGLLSAGDETFGKIIKGDSSYLIPMYQRDYSWDEEHWEDLWNDIIANRAVNGKHYMGSIVLIPKEKKQFEVIDGQQRLTTLTIMILSAISIIKDLIDREIDVDENSQRVELLMGDYIGKKSLSSLTTKNKLRLNENNNPYFSSYLLQFRATQNLRRQPKSNRQLLLCFNYFKERLTSDIYKSENIDGLIDF